MKDKELYKQLNHLKVEVQEVEDVEVNELEHQRVKQSLHASIRREPKRSKWRHNSAAAVMLLAVGGVATGITFPAYAAGIPLIGDVFKLADRLSAQSGLFEHYKEYSTEMNMSAESKGITITLGDAIFDGKVATLTYTLESDRDLGEQPMISGTPSFRGSSGGGGSQSIIKIDAGKYAGIIRTSSIDHNGVDSVKLNWPIEAVIVGDTHERIEGRWSFAVALDATDQQVQMVGHAVEASGVQLTLDRLSMSPMSFMLYYETLIAQDLYSAWDDVDVEFEVRDNLGHVYAGEGNGGSGKEKDGGMEWKFSHTFEKLDPQATELIVTPTLRLYVYTAENHGGIDEHGQEIAGSGKPERDDQFLVLEDIVIPVQQLTGE
ncbi:DUF4179 domain-containing protein [Paenibacillus daejeonensis]|uniref:DUF4179 domain-containing protein n=1 Tax=Paenibacillus daejeonensis TaxID=135193 RepID=UPI00035C29D7|nr:DUF4179 domain-containing protein [Paenibacillus daejeonensis]